MRILLLSWRDPKHPFAGGAEQMIYYHAKGWIKDGHQVVMFSSRFPASPKNDSYNNIQIIRKGHQYIGVQLAAFFYCLTHPAFDLVVDQFHGLSFFTPLYVNKPKIAIIHEVARQLWFLNILPRPFNIIIGTIGYFIEPFIFLFYKKTVFLTISSSTKKDLIKLGIPKKNIKVILNGVTISRNLNLYKKAKRVTITFLGMISKDKGIDDALICFALLNKMGNFNFWVIGRPDSESFIEKLKEQADKLGIKSKLKFWGFVSENKKYELLSKSHILVNPSTREGWGLVNIEANSVGTPVVGYRTSGLVDSVKHNFSGILCKKNTPVELSNEIMKLLKSEVEYAKMQKNSVEWSKNFSWEKAQQKSLKLIKKIVYEKMG